jgi:hypothetical protein
MDNGFSGHYFKIKPVYPRLLALGVRILPNAPL